MANPPTPQPHAQDQIGHVGINLRRLREARGMTREALAAATGGDVSASYVKLIETGARPVQKASTLARLAAALGVDDIAELTGGLTWSIGASSDTGRVIHPATDQIRRLLRRPALTAVPAPEEAASDAALDGLQERCRLMWHQWHTSPTLYTTIAAGLPDLLADAETAVTAVSGTSPAELGRRRRAWALLAQVHHLARQWLRKVQEYGLAEIAAHRAMLASQQADDALLIAFSSWNFAGLHNAAGRYEDGEAVCRQAVEFLDGLSVTEHDERLRGMVGALLLYQAIAVARQQDGDRAWALWEQADRIARDLGPGFWDDWTTFGKANLDLYAVGIQVELGEADAAVRRAGSVDVDAMPCRERQTRYLIDVAKAHGGREEDDAALAVLGQAESIGPEEVTYSYYARDLLRSLLWRSRATNRRELHAMATRLKVVA